MVYVCWVLLTRVMVQCGSGGEASKQAFRA